MDRLTHDERRDRIDKALEGVVGMHGSWVLAIEEMDPKTGQMLLVTYWTQTSAIWSQIGMVEILRSDLSSAITPIADEECDYDD